MSTVTLQEAQDHLPELIAQLRPGEELHIVQKDQAIAKLIRQTPETHKPRQPGSAVGKLTIREEDDVHLEDFEEHM